MTLLKRFSFIPLIMACTMACTPPSGFDALAPLSQNGAAIQARPSADAALAAADATALDEKAATAVELAYQASALAILTATRAGLIEGETATKVAAADTKAYQAVLLVRAAYQAGNARTYSDAAVKAVTAIKSTLALLKGS